MGAIIPFSGGIDSTAVLYKTLTENPDKEYLVVHVQLKNGETSIRQQLEYNAVNSILDQLRILGINNFQYKEASIDYTTADEIPPVWDIETINFMMAIYVRSTSIRKLIKATNADDFLQEDFQDRIDSSEEIFYATTRFEKGSFTFDFPQKEMNKLEVMQSIPQNLLNLTWSCRRPQKDGDSYNKCGKCDTCLMIDKHA